MAHDVFISYSSNDKLAAFAVCAALEAAQIRCWIAPRDLIVGVNYSGQLTLAIKASKAMVLIFSEHSNVSSAVLAEVELAAHARAHILNFRVDSTVLGNDLQFYLQPKHWLDALTPPMEKHHADLVESIRKLPGMNASAVQPASESGAAPEPSSKVAFQSERRPAAYWRLLTILGMIGLGTLATWHYLHPSASKPLSAPTPLTSLLQPTPAPTSKPPDVTTASRRIVVCVLDPKLGDAREKIFIPWCTDEQVMGYWQRLNHDHVPIYKEYKSGDLSRDLYIPNPGLAYYYVRGDMAEAKFWEVYSAREKVGDELINVVRRDYPQGAPEYWALWIPKAQIGLLAAKMSELGITPGKVEYVSAGSSSPNSSVVK